MFASNREQSNYGYWNKFTYPPAGTRENMPCKLFFLLESFFFRSIIALFHLQLLLYYKISTFLNFHHVPDSV